MTVLVTAVVVLGIWAALAPSRIPTHTGPVDLELHALAATLTPSVPVANVTLYSLTGPFRIGTLTVGHVQVVLTIDSEQVYAGPTHDVSYGFPFLMGRDGTLVVGLQTFLPAGDPGETVTVLLYLAPWNDAEIRTSANVGPGSNPYPPQPGLYAGDAASNVPGGPTRLGEWNVTIPPYSSGARATDVTTRGWALFNVEDLTGVGCDWFASIESWPEPGSLMGGHANGSFAVLVRGERGVNVTADLGMSGPQTGASYSVAVYGPPAGA